ncbi:MAG: Ger(x)C family spore germination protein [Alkaliphilus sp.]
MKNYLFIIFSIVIATALCGCWDNKEIDDVASVLAIGVDLVNDGKLNFTVQVTVPRLLQQKGYEKNATVTYSSTGRTFQEALEEIQSTSSREINVGHVQLVVLGDTFAKKGVFDVIDYAERSHEFRVQSTVAVAKNVTAKEVLETISIIEIFPSVHITETIKNKSHIGLTRNVSFLDLLSELNNKGRHLVLPAIEGKTPSKPKYVKDLKVDSLAIFDDEKLISFITNCNAIKGYLWVIDSVLDGLLLIPSPDNPKEFISLEILKSKTKIDVILKDNKFIMSVKIEEDGNISEQQSTLNFTTPDMIAYLESEKRKYIKNNVKEIFDLAQEVYRLDIFGFGTLVSKKYPQKWKEVKPEWDEIFSNSTVEIEVYSKVRRSGQIRQPTRTR